MDETKNFKCMKSMKAGQVKLQVWPQISLIICQKSCAQKAVEKLTDTEAHWSSGNLTTNFELVFSS